MPIDPIVLQRRHAELGRIRLGVKVETQDGKIRPGRLDRFRFTSPRADLIAGLATLYGGEARPWVNGSITEHEVITEATSIPVYVLKGAFSQWFETWSAAGCVHRCTGTMDHTDAANVKPCEGGPLHDEAKPTTRLSVMLPELETLGAWRLETHGWNAAAELPTITTLAEHVGDLVPARLFLATKRKVIQIKGKPQTSIFVVPGLDLEVSKTRLAEIAAGMSGTTAPQIEAAPAPQIEAGPAEDYTERIAAVATRDELNALWHEIGHAGVLDDWKPALLERAAEIAKAEELERVADESGEASWPGPDEDQGGDPDVDAALTALMTAAGRKRMTLPDVEAAFQGWAGKGLAAATAVELNTFREEQFA